MSPEPDEGHCEADEGGRSNLPCYPSPREECTAKARKLDNAFVIANECYL